MLGMVMAQTRIHTDWARSYPVIGTHSLTDVRVAVSPQQLDQFSLDLKRVRVLFCLKLIHARALSNFCRLPEEGMNEATWHIQG